jgi:hypothetical protein
MSDNTTKIRRLSPSFMAGLKSNTGLDLNRLLQTILADHTLCLEIRENYINIYYRGGNLIKLEEKNGKYTAFFDRNYLLEPNSARLPLQISVQKITNFDDLTPWVDSIPIMKYEMDKFFSQRPKDEREFQQVMVRENNFGRSAKGSDYFICDIEYASAVGRFDLIAAHWPSSGAERKVNTNVGLAIIEMKYGEQSMKGSAGIQAHIQDMMRYFGANEDNFAALKEEMRTIFNQKLELGLIDNQKPIKKFNNEQPDFILVLANHDPGSQILSQELKDIESINLPFKLKFAVSNFMGYGLYQQNIFDLRTFLLRYEKQIYSK